jgi:ketosteroid isomerase-like protein
MIASLVVLAALAGAGDASAETLVRQADDAFWSAYNACDRARMADAFTEDAEFYHDITGLTATREAIVASLMHGPCGTPGQRLRREAIPGTVKAYPLAGPYMLLTGEHLFYVQKDGQPDVASARAQFVDVWKLEGDRWRMARVVSYDHGPPPYPPPPIDASFDLRRRPDVAGRYRSPQVGEIVVAVDGSHLHLQAGSLSLTLFPVAASRFAAVERDLQFEFEGTRMTVHEAGKVVSTTTRETPAH